MRSFQYQSYAEFEREELRPASSRVGFSLDELIEEVSFDGEIDFSAVGDPQTPRAPAVQPRATDKSRRRTRRS